MDFDDKCRQANAYLGMLFKDEDELRKYFQLQCECE